jgi:hypothetical protein
MTTNLVWNGLIQQRPGRKAGEKSFFSARAYLFWQAAYLLD